MADEPDFELIERFLNGEEKAFNQLVIKYQKKIYDLVYKMIRNNEDALDLAQEVFVKAYHSLKDFKRQSMFYTWLYKIALNMSLNYLRQKKIRSFVSFFELGESLPSKHNPVEELEKDQLTKAIDQAVLGLPKKQRAIFVLRYYENMPYKEISELLGTSEGALKANYFQALKKLQKKLNPYR